MIGRFSEQAPLFLTGLAALTFLFFSIPLLVAPLRWGRFMGFKTPAETDLAVYFGRSVGALAVALNFAAACAGLTGQGVAEMVALIFAIAVMMVLIHAWGAYKKIQPLSETIEIGFWALLALGAVVVYPG